MPLSTYLVATCIFYRSCRDKSWYCEHYVSIIACTKIYFNILLKQSFNISYQSIKIFIGIPQNSKIATNEDLLRCLLLFSDPLISARMQSTRKGKELPTCCKKDLLFLSSGDTIWHTSKYNLWTYNFEKKNKEYSLFSIKNLLLKFEKLKPDESKLFRSFCTIFVTSDRYVMSDACFCLANTRLIRNNASCAVDVMHTFSR